MRDLNLEKPIRKDRVRGCTRYIFFTVIQYQHLGRWQLWGLWPYWVTIHDGRVETADVQHLAQVKAEGSHFEPQAQQSS